MAFPRSLLASVEDEDEEGGEEDDEDDEEDGVKTLDSHSSVAVVACILGLCDGGGTDARLKNQPWPA